MTTDEIIATIEAIVASPAIHQYKFGLTSNSSKRRKQYLGVGFQHFVIIESRLSAEEALEKEQIVFNALTKSSDKRSAMYRKYHHLSRDFPTARSLGGKKPEGTVCYDLYIAWWSE
jgi:hypothetical protein